MTSLATLPATEVLGRTEPRLFTPPLRELTRETTLGFHVADFARDVVGIPLDPWEEWVAVHGLELLPDGRPRFRKLLIIVARQNGKTHLLVILSLFWLFVQRIALVLGTSTNLGYAKESWAKALQIAQRTPLLAAEMGRPRKAAGEEALITLDGCRYRIAAANADGGRSLTIDRLVLDELRQHHSWDAWDASYYAMNAVPDAQAWAITNQGDAKAVVLASLRADAVEELPGGGERVKMSDPQLFLAEYSAPPGSRADDVEALAMANPNLGRRIDVASLLADARAAVREGGERLARFLTEVLCMRVPVLDPAVDAEAWKDCADPGTLDGERGRLAAVVEVSLDGHAALLVAGMQADGKVRVEVAAAWDDTASARADLPRLVARVKPRKFGWLPVGPTAVLNTALRQYGARRPGSWPPPGVQLEEIVMDVPAVCMGFADIVAARQVLHSDDPLLNDHVTNAERQRVGDRWVFSRKGAGRVHAAYGAAAAVHLARTMPPGSGKPRLVGPRRAEPSTSS